MIIKRGDLKKLNVGLHGTNESSSSIGVLKKVKGTASYWLSRVADDIDSPFNKYQRNLKILQRSFAVCDDKGFPVLNGSSMIQFKSAEDEIKFEEELEKMDNESIEILGKIDRLDRSVILNMNDLVDQCNPINGTEEYLISSILTNFESDKQERG